MADELKLQAASLDNYSPEDRAFFAFWYGHMQDDLMQPPLADIAHSTARYVWDAARRAAPAAAQLDADNLLPIEYDKDMDRTYIPLPGGWEIQTKGKGSTFRIAHASSDARWIVLGEELHEPLEAMARDTRNLVEQYAERIRLLEREKAEQVSAARHDALFAARLACDLKYEARVASGLPREASTARALSDEISAMIAAAPPRTAGTASEAASEAAPDPTEAEIERRAKEIYAGFVFADRYPWADGGNSIRQDEARNEARREFAAAPSTQENAK